jgi:hypothetical protein
MAGAGGTTTATTPDGEAYEEEFMAAEKAATRITLAIRAESAMIKMIDRTLAMRRTGMASGYVRVAVDMATSFPVELYPIYVKGRPLS